MVSAVLLAHEAEPTCECAVWMQSSNKLQIFQTPPEMNIIKQTTACTAEITHSDSQRDVSIAFISKPIHKNLLVFYLLTEGEKITLPLTCLDTMMHGKNDN